jgi:hypothetical protein
MFDSSTIPLFNIKAIKSNNFEIKDLNNGDEFQLWINNEQWMNVTPHHNNTIKQMYSHYDIAYGNVLVTGLGFGIAALWISSKSTVNHVTVVEKSPEVIEAFLAINDKPNNMTIICEDANKFQSDNYFDCILSDHFENENFNLILYSMRSLVKRVPNYNVVWFWPLELIYAKFIILECNSFPENEKYNLFDFLFSETNWLTKYPIVFGDVWDSFCNKHIKNIKLAEHKLEYFYTYFNLDVQ